MSSLTSQEKFDLWSRFIEQWPIAKIQAMTIEEYTSLGSKDSFCFWLESVTEQLGSIWGGSAFKFGIFNYNQDNIGNEKNKTLKDGKYKWAEKYGSTAQEAYSKIHSIILEIIQAAQSGDFVKIDGLDLGHATKWKIAFLYQKIATPYLVCVYREDWLRLYASCYDKNVTTSSLYRIIHEKNTDNIDIFSYSEQIWNYGQKYQNAWLIAPGENARLWEDFQNSNMIKIGWSKTGSISSFQQKEELISKLKETYSSYSYDTSNAKSPNIVANMLWSFYKDVQIGDVIYVKNGASKIIGRGIIKSEYKYGNYGEYCHARDIEWTNVGEWDAANFLNIIKTFTKLPAEKCKNLEELLSNKEQSIMNTSNNKWNIPLALNTIFYGPPGTGKTHVLLKEYAQKYFTTQTGTVCLEERNMTLVSKLSWWETIAVAMLDIDAPVKVPQLLDHPLLKAQTDKSSNAKPGCAVWGQLQIHTKDDCPNVNYDKTHRADPRVFYKNDDSTWEIDKELLREANPELFQILKLYNTAPHQQEIKRYEFITFHQSFSYENFVEGINAKTDDDTNQILYLTEPGIFQKFCTIARANPNEPYALFIDEINRGKISGIFGELITLIEENKREGCSEELKTVLPYSRTSFTVPSNLFIIGSMNTADRSIDALDSALRRRFAFVEMPPKPELLSRDKFRPKFLNLDLQALLENINTRVEYLLDRDHKIGHSYFMTIQGDSFEQELDNLRRVFKDQVIPLLEDYFYGSLDKVAMVLGNGIVKRDNILDCNCLMEVDASLDMPEKTIRRIADISTLSEEDFASLIK